MKLKEGVNPAEIKPQLLLALVVADGVWRNNGNEEVIVTSLNDSYHSLASLHYAGMGSDLRTWEPGGWEQWSMEKKERIAQELREALGNNPDYDVVVENDHIHLEYQPKRREW